MYAKIRQDNQFYILSVLACSYNGRNSKVVVLDKPHSSLVVKKNYELLWRNSLSVLLIDFDCDDFKLLWKSTERKHSSITAINKKSAYPMAKISKNLPI